MKTLWFLALTGILGVVLGSLEENSEHRLMLREIGDINNKLMVLLAKVASIDQKVEELTEKVEKRVQDAKAEIIQEMKVAEKKIFAEIENLDEKISSNSSQNSSNDDEIIEHAILITGSQSDPRSVEALKSDGTPLCSMPDLPEFRRYHAMEDDMLCGGSEARFGQTCLQHGEGGWTKHSWNLIQRREEQLTWRRPNGEGVQLLGGEHSGTTSEIVTPAGSKKGFDLKYDTKQACGIQHDEIFIVTGGLWIGNTVSQYNVTGWMKDLPRLNSGRWTHACGYFFSHSNQMFYLVTGGYGSGGVKILSTEIMAASGSGVWKYAGALPTARSYLKSINVANKLFVIGGYDGYDLADILHFDPTSKKWVKTGEMNKKRKGHALSLLPFPVAQKLCE